MGDRQHEGVGGLELAKRCQRQAVFFVQQITVGIGSCSCTAMPKVLQLAHDVDHSGVADVTAAFSLKVTPSTVTRGRPVARTAHDAARHPIGDVDAHAHR